MANKSNPLYVVDIAPALKYGYDKKYVRRSNELAKLVDLVMPRARRLLDLPSFLCISLKPTKKPTAYYHHEGLQVVIDPRKCRTLTSAVSALMHELVHAEQFNQGRLEIRLTRSRRVVMKWMGSVVVQETRDYEKYRAQPWEVEAFDREKVLTKRVIEMIKTEMEL